jgi:DNA-binding transcriptional regulator YdaS (Cro superfamily)
MENVKELVIELGGAERVAQKLGVNTSAVCNWYKRGIPPRQAIRIEKITGGEITTREIVPKLWEDVQ